MRTNSTTVVRTRGGRGSKIPKFLRTSFMYGPYLLRFWTCSIQNVVKTLISSTPFTPPPTSFQSPEKEAANQKAAAASSWLEQIRGSRDAENGDSHKMALEMSSVGKLMALQSLQNSLQLITMGMAAGSSSSLPESIRRGRSSWRRWSR